MNFKVVSSSNVSTSNKNQAYLVRDNWDDFGYKTSFALYYVDKVGHRTYLGGVKIGQFRMIDEKISRTEVPDEFDQLDEKFFSLGQDDSYYKSINDLGSDIRDNILFSLNDLAKNSDLFDKALNEQVTQNSLLRSLTPFTVKGQFKRLANGGSRLVGFDFVYKVVERNSVPPVQLAFNVTPESIPPTNIHVLIGRNGVGKTHLLNGMINSLIKGDTSHGSFYSNSQNSQNEIFANLVFVSFSAFDESEVILEQSSKEGGIKFSYVGLKRSDEGSNDISIPKSPEVLNNEFVESVEACRSSSRIFRWKRAMEMLEADSNFKEADISSLAETKNSDEFSSKASLLFKRLSSGHKIVLLTITRLVETLEEKTLVLLDEPEAHLHPPLLSAFTRVLSDLLIQKNGVAIAATHSPVVVQEVPESRVWVMRRKGLAAKVDRPSTETFGENVGLLTREVFGLEVTYSGFHKMITDVINNNRNYDEVISTFNGQLGMEARAIIRALVSSQY